MVPKCITLLIVKKLGLRHKVIRFYHTMEIRAWFSYINNKEPYLPEIRFSNARIYSHIVFTRYSSEL